MFRCFCPIALITVDFNAAESKCFDAFNNPSLPIKYTLTTPIFVCSCDLITKLLGVNNSRYFDTPVLKTLYCKHTRVDKSRKRLPLLLTISQSPELCKICVYQRKTSSNGSQYQTCLTWLSGETRTLFKTFLFQLYGLKKSPEFRCLLLL